MLSRKIERKNRISQWYFNASLLSLYDYVVYGFVSKHLWGCSTEFLLERYRTLMSDRHLEVGPGTGYLLDHHNPDDQVVDLMDLSESCLRKTAARLSRYTPVTYKQNILEPCGRRSRKYNSIALNYVLHCVPGEFGLKGIAFFHLKNILNDDGVLFGATVIREDNYTNTTAKLFMRILNMIGLFNNQKDNQEGLHTELKRYFKQVDVRVQGTTALFFATDNKEVFDLKMRKIDL